MLLNGAELGDPGLLRDGGQVPLKCLMIEFPVKS